MTRQRRQSCQRQFYSWVNLNNNTAPVFVIGTSQESGA